MMSYTTYNKPENLSYFKGLDDPRGSNVNHRLSNIVFIAICAVISGAESWEDIELYTYSKQEWLHSLLSLLHGLPSDDTYRWVFSALNPTVFEMAF